MSDLIKKTRTVAADAPTPQPAPDDAGAGGRLPKLPRASPRKGKGAGASSEAAAVKPLPPSPKEPIGCRWIDGEVHRGDWRYCQSSTTGGRGDYCASHAERMWRKDKDGGIA